MLKTSLIFTAIFYLGFTHASQAQNSYEFYDDFNLIDRMNDPEFDDIQYNDEQISDGEDNVEQNLNTIDSDPLGDLIEQEESSLELNINESAGPKENAEYIVINKITARSKKIPAALNTNFAVGNLEVKTNSCVKPADSQYETDMVQLTITKKRELIFDGWLFKKNRAISVLEHPVYDIMLSKCF